MTRVSVRWNVPLCVTNSLAPGRFKLNLRLVIFTLIWMIDCLGITHEIASRFVSFDLTDDKSTLVQAMA